MNKFSSFKQAQAFATLSAQFRHQGDAALDLVGFPRSHGRPILMIAQSEDCVILSREVGVVCTGLIEAGYDTKGYRIHTKSCTWGPMAGFVCVDPRLNKAGNQKVEYNTKETLHALKNPNLPDEPDWKAKIGPIIIEGNRRAQLLALKCITLASVDKTADGRVIMHVLPGQVPAGSDQLNFALIQEENRNLWGVYFDYGPNGPDNSRPMDQQRLFFSQPSYFPGSRRYERAMGLVKSCVPGAIRGCSSRAAARACCRPLSLRPGSPD